MKLKYRPKAQFQGKTKCPHCGNTEDFAIGVFGDGQLGEFYILGDDFLVRNRGMSIQCLRCKQHIFEEDSIEFANLLIERIETGITMRTPAPPSSYKRYDITDGDDNWMRVLAVENTFMSTTIQKQRDDLSKKQRRIKEIRHALLLRSIVQKTTTKQLKNELAQLENKE